MVISLAILACVVCAAVAVRASSLVATGAWLAANSALLATTLYLLDAENVAVIELSVGAGLVAVLFVFSVVGAGGEGFHARPAMPRWVATVLAGVPLAVLACMLIGSFETLNAVPSQTTTKTFADTLWGTRGLDTLASVVLLLVAALGVRALVGGLPDDAPVDDLNIRSTERTDVRA